MARTTTKDKRPRVDVSTGVKSRLKGIRERLNSKTDSDAIAYLIALYDDRYEHITLAKNEQYRSAAEVINNQQSM